MFGRMLNPLIKLLTDEAKAEYKPNRSTLDILSIIENEAQQRKTNQPILIDRPEAFASIGREILGTVLREKGTPRKCIISLQQGRGGTQVRPKVAGRHGQEMNNRGGFHGRPRSAQLRIIYLDAMIDDYDMALPKDIQNE